MKTTLVLKDEVVRQAKRRAAELGMSLSAFAERSLRDALKPQPKPRKPFTVQAWGDPRKKGDLTVAQIKALMNDDLESPE
jgi:hypothetical protein